MKLNKKIASLIVGCSLLFACKYEEGPLVSIFTAEQRIEKSWSFSRSERNGLNVTGGYEDEGITIVYSGSSIGFNDEFRFSEKIKFQDNSNPDSSYTYIVEADGTWELLENKTILKLSYDPPSTAVRELLITRLKKNELFLEEEFNNDILYKYELIPN